MKCQLLMILKNTKSATNILLTKLTSNKSLLHGAVKICILMLHN